MPSSCAIESCKHPINIFDTRTGKTKGACRGHFFPSDPVIARQWYINSRVPFKKDGPRRSLCRCHFSCCTNSTERHKPVCPTKNLPGPCPTSHWMTCSSPEEILLEVGQNAVAATPARSSSADVPLMISSRETIVPYSRRTVLRESGVSSDEVAPMYHESPSPGSPDVGRDAGVNKVGAPLVIPTTIVMPPLMVENADDGPDPDASRCEVCRTPEGTVTHDLALFPLKHSRRSLRLAIEKWVEAYDCPELSQFIQAESSCVNLCQKCVGLFEELDEMETHLDKCVSKIREAIGTWVKEETVTDDPLKMRAPGPSNSGVETLHRIKVEAEDPVGAEPAVGGVLKYENSAAWTEESAEISWRVGPDHSYSSLARVKLEVEPSPSTSESPESSFHGLNQGQIQSRRAASQELGKPPEASMDPETMSSLLNQPVRKVIRLRPPGAEELCPAVSSAEEPNAPADPKVVPTRKRRIKCRKCYCQVSEDRYEDHVKTHVTGVLEEESDELRQCPNCLLTLPVKQMYQHVSFGRCWAEKHWGCRYCTCMFLSPELRADHEASEHGASGPSQPELFLCQDCGKKVACFTSLRQHRFRFHGITDDVREEKIVECPHCDKKFLSQAKLKEHVLARHEDFRPFKCPECKYRSNAFFTLKTHFRMVHKRRIERKFLNVERQGKLGYQGKPYVIFNKDTGEEMVTVRNHSHAE